MSDEIKNITKKIKETEIINRHLKWHDRTLYVLPDGNETYLTKKELEIAEKLLKEAEDGNLPKVATDRSLTLFFRNPYVQTLIEDQKWFAKQFYKSYIMEFERKKKKKRYR